jgi:hypothetical protein
MDDLKENVLRISAGGGLVLQSTQDLLLGFHALPLGLHPCFPGPFKSQNALGITPISILRNFA